MTKRPFAKRSLGQNFLCDPNTARRIVAALDIGPQDRVLEIGPGRGALSEHVCAAGPAVYRTLEKDSTLAAELRRVLPGVDVLEADALAYPWHGLSQDGTWKLLGNLPYNIASPLIWDIAATGSGIERAVFMVQYEVAERLCAQAGCKAYGALGAFVGNFMHARLLFKVGPQVFRPRPKVDSGVVLFLPRPDRPDEKSSLALARLLRMCFQKRRKQLGNILKDIYGPELEDFLSKRCLTRATRPEELSPDTFRELAQLLAAHFLP